MWKLIGCVSFIGIFIATILFTVASLDVMDATADLMRAIAEHYRK